jgi:tetratricopeptide (TPR) repeat protein
MLQSYVYAGLANFQAQAGLKYKQDALTSIELARATFDQAVENKEPFLVGTGFNEGNLLLHSGLAYHHLGMQQKAIDSFARISNLTGPYESYRAESFIDQVMAEVNREDRRPDMDFCIDRWAQGLQGAIALRSEAKFTLAIQVYATMRAVWRGEQRIKNLRKQIEHW